MGGVVEEKLVTQPPPSTPPLLPSFLVISFRLQNESGWKIRGFKNVRIRVDLALLSLPRRRSEGFVTRFHVTNP